MRMQSRCLLGVRLSPGFARFLAELCRLLAALLAGYGGGQM